MANYERGVYEPSDEVRVFDGSEEEDDVEGSRLPLLIVLALLVLAMFAGVVWLAYTQGVARGRGETPVLAAASGPERVAPQQAGGSNVPYQGFKIYEQPAPPDDSADKPNNAAPAETAPVPPAAAPAPVVVKPTPAPVAAPPPAKAAAVTPATAKPVPVKPGPPKSVAALIQQANSAPDAAPAPQSGAMKQSVAPKPSAMAVAKPTSPPPAMKPAMTSTTPVATGAPRQLVVPATPKPAAPVAEAAKPAAGGGYVLQIGAYKSQADADAAWKTYKAKHAALLSGYADDIQQADLGEKGTWYRLRVGGLSDREVATALCERLKADGGACILGK
ncbi:MAG TPA: SPOR domain-containing protein [Rhizomicrobium sp.]|nr:SPOR domain-containing protein [Rhizomicrobium sp.]